MKTKTIFIAFASLFLLASCNGKNKQTEKDSLRNDALEQTQEVDTNKIYEPWEVDTPPAMPR
ncbi:MAG: hypothetical protein Q4G63_07675 [Bacteroidia bacterium]|nr:hypothetical protein [Bacteroidia bacterium]